MISEIFTGMIDKGNSGWLIAVSTVTGKKGRIPLNYVRIKPDDPLVYYKIAAFIAGSRATAGITVPQNPTFRKKARTQKTQKTPKT